MFKWNVKRADLTGGETGRGAEEQSGGWQIGVAVLVVVAVLVGLVAYVWWKMKKNPGEGKKIIKFKTKKISLKCVFKCTYFHILYYIEYFYSLIKKTSTDSALSSQNLYLVKLWVFTEDQLQNSVFNNCLTVICLSIFTSIPPSPVPTVRSEEWFPAQDVWY